MCKNHAQASFAATNSSYPGNIGVSEQIARLQSAPSASQALVFVLKNSQDASNGRKSLILLVIFANVCSGYALFLFAL